MERDQREPQLVPDSYSHTTSSIDGNKAKNRIFKFKHSDNFNANDFGFFFVFNASNL